MSEVILIHQPEAEAISRANLATGKPYLVAFSTDTFLGKLVSVTVRADELAEWRAIQNDTATSRPKSVMCFEDRHLHCGGEVAQFCGCSCHATSDTRASGETNAD